MLKLNDAADYFKYGSLYIEESENLLKNLDIIVKDENGYFDFWDVLEQIALQWNDYSEIQKVAIAKAIAGDDRGSFIIVMGYGRK